MTPEIYFDPFYGKTDKENFVALLNHMGLRKSPSKSWEDTHCLCTEEYILDPVVTELDGSQETQNRVVIGAGFGYTGFYCYFDFDEKGKYLNHACGE